MEPMKQQVVLLGVQQLCGAEEPGLTLPVAFRAQVPRCGDRELGPCQ